MPMTQSIIDALYDKIRRRADGQILLRLVYPSIEHKLQSMAYFDEATRTTKLAKFATTVWCTLRCLPESLFSSSQERDAILESAELAIMSRATRGDIKARSAQRYVDCWRALCDASRNGAFQPRPKRTGYAVQRLTSGDLTEDELYVAGANRYQRAAERDLRRYGLADKARQIEFDQVHRSVLLVNPSPHQTDCFGEISLALIFMLVEKRANELDPATGDALRCLIALSLITGRLIREVALLPLHVRSNGVDSEPMAARYLDLTRECLLEQPDAFAGHPDRITLALHASYDRLTWDARYLPISRRVVIPLAPGIAHGLRDVVTRTGVRRLDDLLPLRRIRQELTYLTAQLHQHAPHVAPLTQSRLALSFNARMAEIDPVYASYIQARAQFHLHMPMRYSYVHYADLHAAYTSDCRRMTARIERAASVLSRQRQLPYPRWLTQAFAAECTSSPPDAELGWGSWRCATPATAVRARRAAAQISPTVLAWVDCLALMGLRPFEILNAKPHQLSTEARWLAVAGKSNIAHPANRVLPVPQILRERLAAQRRSTSSLFARDDGTPFTQQLIEAIISDALGERSTCPSVWPACAEPCPRPDVAGL